MAFDPNAFTQATNFLSSINNFNIPQKHEILTVNSLQQAKDFIVNKGESYLLLDPNADTLYVKECDSIGKISLRSFHIEEKPIEESIPITISKSDYESLMSRLNKLEEGVNVSKESKSKQSNQ